MPNAVPPPPRFDAPLEAFDQRARALLASALAGTSESLERFKWEHPAFADRPLGEVEQAAERKEFDLDDARLVEARSHALDSWTELVDFCSWVKADPATHAFESAIEKLVDGGLAPLRRRLQADPDLVRRRSRRRHAATLLHYIGANGVESHRQRTPDNAVAIARLLLDAGAEVDATADLYGSPCTTLTLLISSHHPAAAGVQPELAGLLIDRGAQLTGPDGSPSSAVRMALSFGYRDTAQALCSRLAPFDDLPVAAGLGDVAAVRHHLTTASAEEQQVALALAALHGEVAVIEQLIAAGVDPSRFNPPRYHAHSTPLHQATYHGHLAAVEALVDGGADLAAVDTVYGATPLQWARHAERTDIETFLQSRLDR